MTMGLATSGIETVSATIFPREAADNFDEVESIHSSASYHSSLGGGSNATTHSLEQVSDDCELDTPIHPVTDHPTHPSSSSNLIKLNAS